MRTLKTLTAVIILVLYGLSLSIIMAAGILWAINSIFRTDFELTIWSYLLITGVQLGLHTFGRGDY